MRQADAARSLVRENLERETERVRPQAAILPLGSTALRCRRVAWT